MASTENTNYLTVELFDTKIESLLSTIRLENEKLRNQLHEEIQDVNVKSHEEIQSVKSTLHEEVQDVKSTLHEEISNTRTELKGEIQTVNARIDATNTRIADLQSSISSYFALATLVITLIGIIISVLVTFAPRIWAFLDRKSKLDIAPEKAQVIIPTSAKSFGNLGK